MESDVTSEETKPVYSFLPPTEDISATRLTIAVFLVGCLTISLCANISHLVLQVYSRRFLTGFPVQHLLALFFLTNALMPLSLPPVILEKLVNLWMFGRLSCLSHHVICASVRVLVPWLLAAICFYTKRSIRTPQRHGIFLVVGLSVLLLAVAAPQGIHAEFQYSVVDRGESNDGSFILRIHISKCVMNIRQTSFAYFQLVTEFIVPYCIIFWNIIRIGRTYYEANTPRILRCLSAMALIHFLCNLYFYLPIDWAAKKMIESLVLSWDTKMSDAISILPYISTTVVWFPTNRLSSTLAKCRAQELRLQSEARNASYANLNSRVAARKTN